MNNKQLVKDKFIDYVTSKEIDFLDNNKVNPYDDTTLFCPAGMQQFKSNFIDELYTGTISNIQSCIRMNDFDEIGDGTHLLSFDMIGLFSFKKMSVFDAVQFWLEFIDSLGIKLTHVTIHPERPEWRYFYPMNFNVIEDVECKWSDGQIGGYCTEFFVGDLEIGNIVNPLGTCIDVGFGLNRIAMLLGDQPETKLEALQQSAIKIIESGYKPSNKLQGYVLRKVLREIFVLGGSIDSEYFKHEIQRQQDILSKYNKLKHKHLGKPKEWFYDTFGINIDEINSWQV